MQLNEIAPIRAIGGALSAATYTLLMGVCDRALAAGDETWRVNTGAMSYNEIDRISVQALILDLRRRISEDEFVTINLGHDIVSGASPTGATYVQTQTSASGGAPMASFSETRNGIGASWERPVIAQTRVNAGLNHSRSETYQSTAGSLVFNTDLNQRNTTFSYGLGYMRERNQPAAGVPEPLSAVGSNVTIGSEGVKRQLDFQVGITQTLGRSTLALINYVRTDAQGYLTNPYKVVSVVNPLTGETLSLQPLHEKRPDARRSNALLGQVNHHFGPGTGYATYRYFWDDWGVHAHTLELKYRQPWGEDFYLQPHVRAYTQNAADFFTPIVTSSQTPRYASADYRQSDLQTVSAGIKAGYRAGPRGEFTVRYEFMRQTGEEHPRGVIGVQRDAKLFPDLTAHIVHIGYTLDF